MKRYKVVSVTRRYKTTDGWEGMESHCSEVSFKFPKEKYNGRQAFEYLLNYYAKQGWRFIQEDVRSYNLSDSEIHLFFERDD